MSAHLLRGCLSSFSFRNESLRTTRRNYFRESQSICVRTFSKRPGQIRGTESKKVRSTDMRAFWVCNFSFIVGIESKTGKAIHSAKYAQ